MRLPPQRPKRERIFGLDLVRAIAVSLVVAGHMLQHSKPPIWLKWVGRLGVLGVEIFFVLSGFLIGGIVIDLIQSGKFQTFRALFQFWSRRWYRTLPLYYLFFFIYLKFDWTGPSRLLDHLEFLGFLQNFAWRGPDFFFLSWSLTIEEYFYLLFPLTFYLAQRFRLDAKKNLGLTLGLFLVLPLAVKAYRAPYLDWEGFDFQLRAVTITRLDSLMYGVGAVFIQRYYSRVWEWFRRLTATSWIPLAMIASYFYLGVPGMFPSRGIQTFLFPVTSFSIALLLPYFAGWKSCGVNIISGGVRWLSEISYSVYLGHILVITFVNRALNNFIPNGMHSIYPYPGRLYPIYFILICILTPITYYGWERPFLRLRDRERLSGLKLRRQFTSTTIEQAEVGKVRLKN